MNLPLMKRRLTLVKKVMNKNLYVNRLGIAPEKSADLRMKNLQQLRYLQQLHDDNILSDTEFLEQKGIILDALHKL